MITIIPTTVDHADEIHAIEMEAFPNPWSKNAILYEINYNHSICLVAWDAEKSTVAGHVTMRHVVNEGHISNIAVAKAYQQQGAGSALMEALVQAAIDREMIGITLEVRPSNHAALALYFKHGFVEEGRRKNFYSHPNEDAIIMWKHLTQILEVLLCVN